MATGTLVSVEEYVKTSHHPGCEYVDGGVENPGISVSLTEIYRSLE